MHAFVEIQQHLMITCQICVCAHEDHTIRSNRVDHGYVATTSNTWLFGSACWVKIVLATGRVLQITGNVDNLKVVHKGYLCMCKWSFRILSDLPHTGCYKEKGVLVEA